MNIEQSVVNEGHHALVTVFRVDNDKEPDTIMGLDLNLAPSWQRLRLIKALRDWWPELDTAILYDLLPHFEWQHLTNGDILCYQGHQANEMYLVIQGHLRTVTTTADGSQITGEIGPGETVGELALLSDHIRSATVYAVRATTVIKINQTAFVCLVRAYPPLLAQITDLIVARQKQSLQPVNPQTPKTLTMTLLPASPTVDVWRFAQELAGSLTPYGSVLPLNSQTFEQCYGQPGASQIEPDDPEHSALIAWLDQLETSYNIILFVADFADTAWTKRCIGNVDRVLVIADSQSNPQPSLMEQSLSQRPIPLRTELVLWHPDKTERPSGTRRWLDARQVRNYYHVRQGEQSHMERLARRLTGNAIGIVLSGGGARGFAHLGVHRAMEELNIPIDYVGGSSMGAVIGAGFFMADTNAQMCEVTSQFAKPKVLLDYTLPFTALMSSKKMTKFTQDICGDVLIEDLWFPFFCVATNLSTAEPVIFERGPLWRAVRASLSLPGIFTPVIEKGEVLVDGGIMDNFPVQLMAERCESEHIIGVKITQEADKQPYYDLDTDICGWHILLNRLNPFSNRLQIPSLMGILMQTTSIHSTHQSKASEILADLMIQPDVKKFGMLDFAAFAEIIQIGYESALAPLRGWQTKRLSQQTNFR